MFAPPLFPAPERRQGAFTLVEALVVVGVLALLVLIAIPAATKALHSGRMAKSIRHLKIIHAGLALYINDHQGRLPEASGYATCPILPNAASPNAFLYWFDALAYYIEGTEYIASRRDRVAQRPEWQTCPARVLEPAQRHSSRGQGISVGYGWNHKYFGYDRTNSSGTSGYASRLTEVSLPAETIIIGTNSEESSPGVPMSAAAGQNANLYLSPNLSRRFDGAGLYLFLDGHIQRLTPEEILENDGRLFKKSK